MDLESVICNYIYGSFQVLKLLFDTVKKFAMRFIDVINAVANAMNSLIDTMMATALTALVEGIMKMLNKLADMMNPLNFSTGGNLCDASWKCAFLLKDILDTNSSSGEATKCILGENTAKSLSSAINTFEAFANTICNFGISLNIGINAMKTVLEQFRKKVEDWIEWIDKKLEKIRKLIDKFTSFLSKSFASIGIISDAASNILDLLSKLALFLNCVINDSVDCAAVDSAISYYNDALDSLCLAPSGSSFGISVDAYNNWVGGGQSFKQQCNGALSLIDDALAKLENPAGACAAANAYDVSGDIVGLGKAIASPGGLKNNLRKVPIFDKILNTKDEVLAAWRKDHKTSSNCDNEILRNMFFDEEHGKIFVADEEVRIKVRTEPPPSITPGGAPIRELEVNPDCECGGLSTPISMPDGSMISGRQAALGCFIYAQDPDAHPEYSELYKFCKDCSKYFTKKVDDYNLARKVGY